MGKMKAPRSGTKYRRVVDWALTQNDTFSVRDYREVDPCMARGTATRYLMVAAERGFLQVVVLGNGTRPTLYKAKIRPEDIQ